MVNAFTYEMFLCIEIESFVGAIVSWYHVTLINISLFYLYKKCNTAYPEVNKYL